MWLVKPANEHSTYTLGYIDFVVPIVKAIQQQQGMIEELKTNADNTQVQQMQKTIQSLQAEVDELKAALEKLEKK